MRGFAADCLIVGVQFMILTIKQLNNSAILKNLTILKTALNFLLLFSIILLIFRCTPTAENNSAADRLLAEVGSKKLYLSELDGMIPVNGSSEDSSLVINALVERWAREAVLLTEAEMNVPKGLNIDKLVRDYRSSLVKSNYETILVEQLLDSLVTEQELTTFYEAGKEQFSLDEPILRCRFIKIDKTLAEIEQMKSWWKDYSKDENATVLKEYAKQNASISKLKEETWYDLSEISQELPAGKLTSSNLKSKKEIVTSDEQFQYFYFPLETIEKNAEPPFDYVKNKIKRVILHRRKQALLNSKKEEMYARELRRNSVKIYK